MEVNKLENTVKMICNGCLSNDRRVFGLGEYSEMYVGLIANRVNFISSIDNIRVCWECKGMLKKFKLFQQQLHAAQDALTQMLYEVEHHPVTLSKLTTAHKYYIDYDYSFIETTLINKNDVDKVVKTATNFVVDIKVECTVNDEPYASDIPDSKDEMGLKKFETPKVEIPIEFHKKTLRPKRRKLVNSRFNSTYYKQYAILIPGKKKNWGKLGNHFSMTMFSEAEMEEHFLSKERKFSEYTRFKFKCDLCQLGYMKVDDLKRHNDLNHLDLKKPIKCSLCSKFQSSLTSLELHWRTHTLIAKCKMCKDYCRPRGMKIHLNHSHTHRYACRLCNMSFGKILHFSVHYKEMHQKYICDYCNKICKTKKFIEKHIRTNHTQMTCKECNRTFPNSRHYKRHCYELHPSNYTSRPELAYCVECNIQYDTMHKYKNHLQTSPRHADVERITFPCTVCGKIFRKRSNFNNHYSLYHAKKTKHYCVPCDKYYSTSYALRRHTADVHMKVEIVKDKICDLCGRCFAANRTLLNHRRTHTGERPYQCPHCTTSFIQRTAMVTHCKTQHKDVK